MKNRKERRHAVKQANTLETSKKSLQKALMGALHTGGFLFSNNGKEIWRNIYKSNGNEYVKFFGIEWFFD